MLQQIEDNLYRLQIQLPGNPLKTLNSYIMTSDNRNLIIDTGFNLPECLEDLHAGIEALGLDMEKTDVLATHFHADHTGLISKIITDRSKVYMGRVDKQMFENTITHSDEYWVDAEAKFRSEGYPERELEDTRMANPARKFTSSALFEITPLDDGDMISCGNFEWAVISTPGHTPGHICLYERKHKMMITGDHLLFDITPNITWWETMQDSLGSYINSLKKISAYDVERVLTGHRGIEGSFGLRINELLAHHESRLNDIIEIVWVTPNISGYEIASRMKWSIRAKNWAEFPPGQRWFAVGEAVAHINHLVISEKLCRKESGGVATYILC